MIIVHMIMNLRLKNSLQVSRCRHVTASCLEISVSILLQILVTDFFLFLSSSVFFITIIPLSPSFFLSLAFFYDATQGLASYKFQLYGASQHAHWFALHLTPHKWCNLDNSTPYALVMKIHLDYIIRSCNRAENCG